MNSRFKELAQLLVDERMGAVTNSGGSPKVLVVVPTVDVAQKMQIANQGEGPLVILGHGFPEL